MLIFKRCTRHEYREYYMGNKFCKNNILAFGAYFVLGVCLLFYSCKNKPNSSNGNFTIAESEVSEEKVLPPKDIDSPVKVKEERVYSSNNGSLQDGLITTYDNYVWAKSSTYNDEGYLVYFSYKNGSNSEEIKYKYDFSDENYSYVYSGSQKYVYGRDGNLLKQFSNGELMYLYRYNSNGQETSKIEYNEGQWAYKNLISYDGNIKTTLVIHNEEGKEIKEQEIKEKFDKKGNIIEKTEYYYNNGIKEKQYYIVYEPDRMSIIRKTKCFRTAKRNVQKAKRNVFVLDTLPSHIKIALERLSCLILTLFLYLLIRVLPYHHFKALHISELQAAIFCCLEQLLLIYLLNSYLNLGIGKVREIFLGLLLLVEEILINLRELS